MRTFWSVVWFGVRDSESSWPILHVYKNVLVLYTFDLVRASPSCLFSPYHDLRVEWKVKDVVRARAVPGIDCPVDIEFGSLSSQHSCRFSYGFCPLENVWRWGRVSVDTRVCAKNKERWYEPIWACCVVQSFHRYLQHILIISAAVKFCT